MNSPSGGDHLGASPIGLFDTRRDEDQTAGIDRDLVLRLFVKALRHPNPTPSSPEFPEL
jgi:hypothetical protein